MASARTKTVKISEADARAQALELIRVAAVAADKGDRADAVSLMGAGIRRKAAIGDAFYAGYKVIAGATGAAVVAVNHADAFATVATTWGLKRVGKGLDIPGVKPRSWSTLSEDWVCFRNVAHIDAAVTIVDEVGQPIDTKHVIPALRSFGAGNSADKVRAAVTASNPTAAPSDGGTTTRHTVAASMGAAIVGKSTLDAVLSPVGPDHVKVRDAAHRGLGKGLLDLVKSQEFRDAIAGAAVGELRLLARIVDGAIDERVKLDKLTPAAPVESVPAAVAIVEAAADAVESVESPAADAAPMVPAITRLSQHAISALSVDDIVRLSQTMIPAA